MKYTLEDIWEQASSDKFAMRIDSSGYEAIIIFGCRITRDFDTKKVMIFNTGRGGDYYLPLEDEETKDFLQKGWRYGCYVVSLSNYRRKLKKIEIMIRNEVNGKNNPKQIQSYKVSRDNVMDNYREISNKLNKIK